MRPMILKEYSNSIVLVNLEHVPKQFILNDYVASITKLPDSKNISIGVITHDKNRETKDEILEFYYGPVFLGHVLNQLENTEDFILTGKGIYSPERYVGPEFFLSPYPFYP